MSIARPRARYALLALVTVVAGLVVHFHGGHLPWALRDKLGDALWAMMITFGLGVLWPDWSPRMRAAVAMGICSTVEVGQLWHAPWLDALRATTLGHLALGSGFDARDLVAYALGVAVATILARRIG